MRGFGTAPIAVGLSICIAAPGFATDQQAREVPLEVPRAASHVTIDGVIDEPAWNEALRLELDYEVSPGDNIPPPVRTEVFLTYDDHQVLVAFRAYDPEPGRIRARYRDRDHAWQDDWVGIVLDTFNDERRAYEFLSNPLGVQTDAINDDVNHNYDESWDAIWASAGRLTDFGYEVEIAIPFNQIRFQDLEGPQIWGIDAIRSYPRKDRHHIGLFPRERGANSYLAQERKVSGFAGASIGRNLELVPTLTGFASQERPDFPDSDEMVTNQDLELGITGTWGITPNFTLTGAVNPDFSQVEADAIQLAINTRFALYFPEKRPFFLESSDYFDTGLRLLYTRNIADPSVALKITGKTGPHTFGLFAARDEVTNVIVPGTEGSTAGSFDVPNTSVVGRYRYSILSDSTVGAVVTDREGSDGYFNRLAGVDAVVRPTEADEFTLNAAWSRTRYSELMQEELEVDGDVVSGHAIEFEYTRTKRKYFLIAELTDVTDGFRADLGFFPQVGHREIETAGGYVWWGDEGEFFNRLEAGGYWGRNEDQDGGLLEQTSSTWFEYSGVYESFMHLELAIRDMVFEGVRFPDQFSTYLYFESRPFSWLGFELNATVGDWIDFSNVRPADQVRSYALFNLDLGRHLLLEFAHSFEKLDVEGGRLFEANAPELRAIWQFNTRTFIRAIVQFTQIERNPDLYDDEVDALNRDFFTQLLFSYKLNPRTVVFLGYSEFGIESQDFQMTSVDRTLFVKLGYSWFW